MEDPPAQIAQRCVFGNGEVDYLKSAVIICYQLYCQAVKLRQTCPDSEKTFIQRLVPGHNVVNIE